MRACTNAAAGAVGGVQNGDMWSHFPDGPRPAAPGIDEVDMPATPTGVPPPPPGLAPAADVRIFSPCSRSCC